MLDRTRITLSQKFGMALPEDVLSEPDSSDLKSSWSSLFHVQGSGKPSKPGCMLTGNTNNPILKAQWMSYVDTLLA